MMHFAMRIFFNLKNLVRERTPVFKSLQRIYRDRLSRRRNRDLTLLVSHSESVYEPSVDDGGPGRIHCFTEFCKDCVRNTYVLLALIVLGLYFMIVGEPEMVTRMRYRMGWVTPAVISISILESAAEINYPEENIIPGNGKLSIKSFLNNGGDMEENFSTQGIFWKVDGFSKYIDHFHEGQNPKAFGKFERIFTETEELNLQNVTGLWIFGGGQVGRNYSVVPAIRAFMITDHVINNFKVDLRSLEVGIIIRAATIGEATLLLNLEDSLSDKVHKERIRKRKFRRKGFCNLIVDVPFDKRVNMFNIRPVVTNMTSKGVVVIDKVIIIVAKRGITESILYSMAPTHWC